jgi:Phosphodiester glycosidase
LILATIESPHGGDGFGVDENQMSEVMVRLGAARSYALDGGGSTELVAKLPKEHKLSIRTPTPNGHERRIPVGIGVYSLPKPKHHRHHTHGHKKPKKKTKGGLLGGILGGLLQPPKPR